MDDRAWSHPSSSDFLSISASARLVYERTPLPELRHFIERVFLGDRTNGVIAEHCGDSGFRLVSLTSNKATPLTGAESSLSALCWYPQGAYKSKGTKRKRGSSTSVRFDDGRSYFGRAGGKRRGDDVHVELEHYVRWSQSRFDEAHPRVDPMTYAVLNAILDANIKCIDGNRIVYDKTWRRGTALDLLGYKRNTGEAVVFEVKTGYDACFDEPDTEHPWMRAPFDDIANTPLNRARFQALFGAILTERAFGVHITYCYVIHVASSAKKPVLHGLGPVASYRAQLELSITLSRPLAPK